MSPADLDLLIHRYFDGTLSPEEEASFGEQLRTDPAAADRFVELAELESGLVESLKADQDMPSGVYTVIHGTRRRSRPLPPVQARVSWPYWVAAGLFIAALSLLLRTGARPNYPRDLPLPAPLARDRGPDLVPEPRPASDRGSSNSGRSDLEARKIRQQEVLQQLDNEELDLARRQADVPKEEPAGRDLERSRAELAARRREEAAKLARVEEDLARPEPTRAAIPPTPATGAILESVEGEAAWAGEPARPLQAGQPVPAGSSLQTHGVRSRLVVKLSDETRIELRGDSRMEEIQASGDQKRFTLTQGTLYASVAKQSGGRSIVVLTPHAELTVLGTRFLLQVGADETRLDVEEGRIRNRRLSDKKVVEVPAGHTISTGRSGPLASRLLPVVRSFQDGVLPAPDYAGTRDTSISSASPSDAAGAQDLLRLYRQPGGDLQNIVLLRWDASSIPPRSRVVAAEVSFWVTGAIGGPGARVFEVRRPWEESEATWKLARSGVPWQLAGARGEQDAAITRSLGAVAPSAPGWSTFPLNEAGVALVQLWVSVPSSNHGLGIAKEPPNAWDLASREWANPEHRPKLTVSYLPPTK